VVKISRVVVLGVVSVLRKWEKSWKTLQ